MKCAKEGRCFNREWTRIHANRCKESVWTLPMTISTGVGSEAMARQKTIFRQAENMLVSDCQGTADCKNA